MGRKAERSLQCKEHFRFKNKRGVDLDGIIGFAMEVGNTAMQHHPSMEPDSLVPRAGLREIERVEGGNVASSVHEGTQAITGALETASNSTGCRSYDSDLQNPTLLGSSVMTSLSFKKW